MAYDKRISTALEVQGKRIKSEVVENWESQCSEVELHSPQFGEAEAWLVLISE